MSFFSFFFIDLLTLLCRTKRYKQLKEKIDESNLKTTIAKYKQCLKKLEKEKQVISNKVISLQTSINRKKKQLEINETLQEREIDDAITNSV